MGKARCSTFKGRLNGSADGSNLGFLQSLQQLCSSSSNSTLADLDFMTPTAFDNQYYLNLLSGHALLGSDHLLRSHPIVQSYAHDLHLFFHDFKNAMIKMGSFTNPGVGQIRTNCRAVNQIPS